jgi:predicted O-methyltransferase YrrM
MSWMTTADFEARYRTDPDPWAYETSGYEREKYATTLAACGPGPFRCALELGSSIGVFSAMLAPRCERLVTVDVAPTAVAAARERLATLPQVAAVLGEIPEAIPPERFDLVVASEILYYLAPDRLEQTLELVLSRMRRGARLVAVHWRPPGPERPFDADGAHERLRAQPGLATLQRGGSEEYRLDVMERR